MSAITGIWDLRAMAGSASASSWLGQATRTMSQPVAVSSAICCRVALMSVVGVVVMDCTEMGASPPTSTLPTLIVRVLRRGARTGGGAAGMPRAMGVPAVMGSVSPWSAGKSDRVDQVRVYQQHGHPDQGDGHGIGHRQCLRNVDGVGFGQAAQSGP